MATKTTGSGAHADGDHGAAACCCKSLEALACAAHSVHEQHCCCTEAGDAAGCACCAGSMTHILDAMEAHIKCLRGVCAAAP